MTCSKQFTFLLILLTYGFVVFSREDVSLKNRSERIKRWPNRLSIQVNNAFEDSVGLSRLQSLVDKASHRTNSGNGGELLVNISAVIDNKLQAALQALITNKELIESAHQLTNESINDNCCDSSYDMKYYDERFSRKVNTSFICALSPSSSSNSPVVPSLENVYKKNLIKSAAVKWQYFGSSSGSYHQYPASDDVCSKTETFDPRLR